MRRILLILMLLFPALVASAEDVKIGYIGYDVDPRFDEDFAYARIELRSKGDTLIAANLAIEDLKPLIDARGLTLDLDAVKTAPDNVLAEAEGMVDKGATFIIADLAAEDIDRLAAGLADRQITIINTTAPEDWLRTRCYGNLLHSAASDRMISDALVQHMVRQKWQSVLVLHGQTERDRVRAESFAQAAERFRRNIVDTRAFDLSTNPAQREQNNIALLTGGTRNYDTVFIADERGEYSRYVPYQTALPRPIIGATGLVALEWHWSLERYGAPQVNSRFEEASPGNRRMGWQDWSVWAGTRAVLTAVTKSRDRSATGMDDYLRSHRLRLDGSKGAAMTFRPWNGQLRMPILLATHNAIIDIAPLEGFEHQTNTLDSLGQDEAEFACE